MKTSLRAPVLAALAFLEKHPGGKYRRFNWEEGRKPTISLNFDSQGEAETWASANLGDTYRETSVFSDGFGYLAHEFTFGIVYAHFQKKVEQREVSEV